MKYRDMSYQYMWIITPLDITDFHTQLTWTLVASWLSLFFLLLFLLKKLKDRFQESLSLKEPHRFVSKYFQVRYICLAILEQDYSTLYILMGKKLLGQRIRANLSFASNLMENIAHFCTCNSNQKERHFLSENIKSFKKSI